MYIFLAATKLLYERSFPSVCLSIRLSVPLTWTITPVWIHQWLWNDAQSLKWYRRGALMFFKVICQISRSHGTQIHQFWPKLSISRLHQILWAHGPKNWWFGSNLSKITRPVVAIKSLRFAYCFFSAHQALIWNQVLISISYQSHSKPDPWHLSIMPKVQCGSLFWWLMLVMPIWVIIPMIMLLMFIVLTHQNSDHYPHDHVTDVSLFSILRSLAHIFNIMLKTQVNVLRTVGPQWPRPDFMISILWLSPG